MKGTLCPSPLCKGLSHDDNRTYKAHAERDRDLARKAAKAAALGASARAAWIADLGEGELGVGGCDVFGR
jgi:hypothetical protein